MSFTYSTSDLTTALAKVRLEISDTDSSDPLFTDEEINVKLAERADNVLLTAADLCEILARRFSRKPKFSTDNQSFDWAGVVKGYRDLAAELRERASGLSTLSPIRVDGYSQDIDNQSVRESDTNPRRRYFGPGPDAPF